LGCIYERIAGIVNPPVDCFGGSDDANKVGGNYYVFSDHFANVHDVSSSSSFVKFGSLTLRNSAE
jgi:hypothetical protein